jgi:hypothetical protein
MPATAAARRVAASPARRATANRQALKPRPRRAQPARRSTGGRAARPRAASRRRRGQTPIGGFVPVAVGATAGAIGGIADSGLVVRLTRGRLWIGALGTLLVGIVALNVFALSFNASSSRLAEQTDGLKRANSALQARIAGELSNEKVLAAAESMGLVYPAPNDVRALAPSRGDAALAARRLAGGDFTIATASPATPAVTAPVDPAVTVPAPTAPVATEPAPVAPVTPAAAPAGGVTAP